MIEKEKKVNRVSFSLEGEYQVLHNCQMTDR
jgi:hypothetical protein